MTQNIKVNPASLRIPTKAYSQGVVVPCGSTNLCFVTGQLPQDIDGKIIHTDDPEKQTRLIFSRISDILQEAKMSLDDIVKMQIYVKDIKYAKTVSSIRDELLSNSKPASTLVEVSGFVKEGCCLEIDVVAAKQA
jgi:enamine deaminase RidA (YjgF/YER057c/UK114 family)